MIVEYRNAFNKLAHDPFCTACPGLDRCPGLGLFADMYRLIISQSELFWFLQTACIWHA